MTMSVFGLFQISCPVSYKFIEQVLFLVTLRLKNLPLPKFQRFISHYWTYSISNNFRLIMHLRPIICHLSVNQLCEAASRFTSLEYYQYLHMRVLP